MRRISNAVMPHGRSTLWGAIRRAYGATRDRVDGQGWTTPLVDDFFRASVLLRLRAQGHT